MDCLCEGKEKDDDAVHEARDSVDRGGPLQKWRLTATLSKAGMRSCIMCRRARKTASSCSYGIVCICSAQRRRSEVNECIEIFRLGDDRNIRHCLMLNKSLPLGLA